MLEFFYDYGLFVAKAATLLAALLLLIGVSAQLAQRRRDGEGHIEVIKLNDQYEDNSLALREAVLEPAVMKQQRKAEQKQEKQDAKALAKRIKRGEDVEAEHRRRVYVLDFDGDIKASEVEALREEITTVLAVATERDEIMVRLESGGGMVHSYGLAASQLQRIRDQKVPLVVCVDRVAASGGYMMACVADRLLAAPFAVLGSIGVIAQMPNFHRLLKKNDIDFELLTAGEYKRTLTMFGENTDKGRRKFIEDLEDTHELFKQFVGEHRPQLDLSGVANGDVWFGRRALENSLIDEISTSDEYLINACRDAEVYRVRYVEKKSLPERFGFAVTAVLDRLLLTWWDRAQKSRFFS